MRQVIPNIYDTFTEEGIDRARLLLKFLNSAINAWRMSLQACLWRKEKILSKCCNNIDKWLNQQHYHMCETLIREYFIVISAQYVLRTFAFHKVELQQI